MTTAALAMRATGPVTLGSAAASAPHRAVLPMRSFAATSALVRTRARTGAGTRTGTRTGTRAGTRAGARAAAAVVWLAVLRELCGCFASALDDLLDIGRCVVDDSFDKHDIRVVNKLSGLDFSTLLELRKFGHTFPFLVFPLSLEPLF